MEGLDMTTWKSSILIRDMKRKVLNRLVAKRYLKRIEEQDMSFPSHPPLDYYFHSSLFLPKLWHTFSK